MASTVITFVFLMTEMWGAEADKPWRHTQLTCYTLIWRVLHLMLP